MVDHTANRDMIVRELRAELVGPSPQGEPIDCGSELKFDAPDQAYAPRCQSPTGEEILLRDSPTKRYGVSVLYPMGTPLDTEPDETRADPDQADVAGLGTTGEAQFQDVLSDQDASASESSRDLSEGQSLPADGADGDDLDISPANAYRQSSMAISFLAEFTDGSKLVLEATGGRYRKKKIKIQEAERTWWLRSPVSLSAEVTGDAICAEGSARPALGSVTTDNLDGMDIRMEVHSRPYHGAQASARLLTVCLVNRTPASGPVDELSLFQSQLSARVVSPVGSAHILPYPRHPSEDLDEEERSLDLLYRNMETYAVGHGCAADWTATDADSRAVEVRAESLPAFPMPSITPDVKRDDGSVVEVPMKALAGLVPGNDGHEAMAEVVALYERWIGQEAQEAFKLDPSLQATARRHLDQCRACATRMRDGLAYLREDKLASRAFQLANHALLLQQISAAGGTRAAEFRADGKTLSFADPYVSPDRSPLPPGRGMWRAFQIAFLLMAVRSSADASDPDRSRIELIWFPTGGGKTEAYLGLASFTMFLRRLRQTNNVGVSVLMRYTLRLLTAQQFLRAAGLMCAMERIRRDNPGEIGESEFSIGIWLGGSTTPNTREQARQALRALRQGAGNQFVLDRCPWCSAQLGRIESRARGRRRSEVRVIGYEPQDATVVLRCPDSRCLFHGGLPVYVIDDDIYEKRPSLVIGTVDKFAMLAWRPEARPLFGISADGTRLCSPPGLIIQDELHLISGPLGSMVGLYETVIEELCTESGEDGALSSPKIVCSTATIRRYSDQIKALYGRQRAALFPPPGLSAEDSFFARYARDADGSLHTGRLYIGVHAPGLGSLQTVQVRTLASLLQSPVPLSDEERDPWWTLVVFFNSLRELGTTLSLLQSDIPDRLKAAGMRLGIGYGGIRRYPNVLELTGRISSDRVPGAISQLEVGCGMLGRSAVDVCLASSIMEVGIDIDRLSLMAVVGQPKMTSQYIQVTGRVGRNWRERPGLVVTMYSASKPRDRSHFEKFRSYHERLYAQVEPTSVTPFSPPALDRALHAVMAAYVRQQGSKEVADSPYPVPSELLQHLRAVLVRRIKRVAPEELENFERVFSRRLSEWRRWERIWWTGAVHGGDVPLLREAGAFVSPELAAISWPTPMSMRNVDAECQAEITTLYMRSEGEDAEGAH